MECLRVRTGHPAKETSSLKNTRSYNAGTFKIINLAYVFRHSHFGDTSAKNNTKGKICLPWTSLKFSMVVIQSTVFNYLLSTISVTKSCLTLCKPMNCSMPGFPVLYYSTTPNMSDQIFVTLGLSHTFFICEIRWANQMNSKMYTLLIERCCLLMGREGKTNLSYSHILWQLLGFFLCFTKYDGAPLKTTVHSDHVSNNCCPLSPVALDSQMLRKEGKKDYSVKPH